MVSLHKSICEALLINMSILECVLKCISYKFKYREKVKAFIYFTQVPVFKYVLYDVTYTIVTSLITIDGIFLGGTVAG